MSEDGNTVINLRRAAARLEKKAATVRGQDGASKLEPPFSNKKRAAFRKQAKALRAEATAVEHRLAEKKMSKSGIDEFTKNKKEILGR